jgi:nucleoside-diphosphate-sugar epimerase
MKIRTLVVGGTGPTGVHIVNFLIQAGHEVTIFNSGKHDSGVEFAGQVERIYGNPRDEDSVHQSIATREWDVAICTYGKLTMLASQLAGKTKRLVGITGQPVYRGAARRTPDGGLSLPVPEFAPRQYDAANYTGRVALGEDQLFAQHGAGDFETVILRYPGIYGPRAPINHEWAVIKRVIDQRPFMLMPHGGMSYFQRGYAKNVAWLVFLAATRPEAAGNAFNAGDEQVLSARRVAEVILDELNSSMMLINIPAEFCRDIYPLAEKAPLILDMSKARNLLGYRDLINAEDATRITARWYFENPVSSDFDANTVIPAAGSFNYDEEDRLLALWQKAANEIHGGLKSSEVR